jgi:hypothetical protein
MVQVHHSEGVAIHIGPESCAVGCEAAREALTEERTGQPLSRAKTSRRRPGGLPVRFWCWAGVTTRSLRLT